MIKGHGDDIYQYNCPLTSNFSSNVFGRVDLKGLKAHLCNCMDEIGSYPEPEPYMLESRLAKYHQLQLGEVCVTNGATEASIKVQAMASAELCNPASVVM